LARDERCVRRELPAFLEIAFKHDERLVVQVHVLNVPALHEDVAEKPGFPVELSHPKPRKLGHAKGRLPEDDHDREVTGLKRAGGQRDMTNEARGFGMREALRGPPRLLTRAELRKRLQKKVSAEPFGK
jgi:hypothetical protein